MCCIHAATNEAGGHLLRPKSKQYSRREKESQGSGWRAAMAGGRATGTGAWARAQGISGPVDGSAIDGGIAAVLNQGISIGTGVAVVLVRGGDSCSLGSAEGAAPHGGDGVRVGDGALLASLGGGLQAGTAAGGGR